MPGSCHSLTAVDLHVDEMVQIGLRSRYARRGRDSWQEEAQRQLNGWLVPRDLLGRDALRSKTARATIPRPVAPCT